MINCSSYNYGTLINDFSTLSKIPVVFNMQEMDVIRSRLRVCILSECGSVFWSVVPTVLSLFIEFFLPIILALAVDAANIFVGAKCLDVTREM